jgi:hypothetical protein
MKYVDVLGYHLTLPSAITLACGVILAIILSIYKRGMLSSSLFILMGFMIASYNVQCSITGHCVTWSWVLSASYLIYTISILYLVYNDRKISIKHY